MRNIVIGFLAFLPIAAAQGKIYDNNFHGWFVYNGDHPVSDRWGVHIEGQWRRHEVLRPQQLLLRWAANYQVNSKLSLSAGYGWVSTHRYGDRPVAAPFPESRIYEQAVLNTSAKGSAFQQRFRLEQRWLGVRSALPNGGDRIDLGTRYQNRFRYLFRMTHPLKDPVYLAAYDEIFFNLPPLQTARAFDQNRAFIGLGFKLDQYNRLETGYMLQNILQRNGVVMEMNHTMHVTLYSTIPFRR